MLEHGKWSNLQLSTAAKSKPNYLEFLLELHVGAASDRVAVLERLISEGLESVEVPKRKAKDKQKERAQRDQDDEAAPLEQSYSALNNKVRRKFVQAQ